MIPEETIPKEAMSEETTSEETVSKEAVSKEGVLAEEVSEEEVSEEVVVQGSPPGRLMYSRPGHVNEHVDALGSVFFSVIANTTNIFKLSISSISSSFFSFILITKLLFLGKNQKMNFLNFHLQKYRKNFL